MINALFSAKPAAWDEFAPALRDAFDAAGLQVDLSRDHDPAGTDYIIFAPNGPVSDFTPFTRCKAVLGLWAGVEQIVGNTTLTQSLARMVDHGLTEGMVEYVTGHVLRHHLGMDHHIINPARKWDPVEPPLARDRRVTVLGLGALGAACASALASLNFQVTGWSRNPKAIENVTCLSGNDGLNCALQTAEILVLLLPLTDATTNILNANTLASLPHGAFIINPARGPMIDDDALITALDRGQVAHATLDVFHTEPLPDAHPFWTHDQVTVTPHIASTTRPETAAKVIAENISRGEAGLPFRHLVDRAAGY